MSEEDALLDCAKNKENKRMFNKELTESFNKIADTMVAVSNTMTVINESLRQTQIVQQKLIEQVDELNDRVSILEKKVG